MVYIFTLLIVVGISQVACLFGQNYCVFLLYFFFFSPSQSSIYVDL